LHNLLAGANMILLANANKVKTSMPRRYLHVTYNSHKKSPTLNRCILPMHLFFLY